MNDERGVEFEPSTMWSYLQQASLFSIPNMCLVYSSSFFINDKVRTSRLCALSSSDEFFMSEFTRLANQ